jgi:phytoene synthase
MTQTHGETQSFALEHCTALVKAADEDLWLCLPYVDRADRLRVAALYALAIELRRIPAAVSEAPLGEIRLQWWRDALDEILQGQTPRAHPVVQALAASGAVDQRMRDIAERGIEARARLLYDEAFESAANLGEFFADAEGWLAEVLTPGADVASVRASAAAYALARWSPALKTRLQDDPFAHAAALARQGDAGDLRPSGAYLALAHGYIARPDGAPWPLRKRLALLKAVAAARRPT